MIVKKFRSVEFLRGMTITLALAVGALAALPAAADVFTWKDPQTGKTRMSNIAPPWLREPVPGQRVPKVEVIRDNKVIDPATAFANPQRLPAQAPVIKSPPAAGAAPPAGSRPAAPAVPEDES